MHLKNIGSIKGGIYESLITDILIKKNIDFYYFKNSNSTKEIEFLIENNEGVIPIEVKASNNKSISLDNYIIKYNPKISYKLINGNIGYKDNKIILPLYMIES